jgi:hypothetical protein
MNDERSSYRRRRVNDLLLCGQDHIVDANLRGVQTMDALR